MRHPQGQFRAVLDTQLSENGVQIFLNRAFREVQIAGDFFVRLGLVYQSCELFFSGTQSLSRFRFAWPGLTALGANVGPTDSPELLPATRTASQCGCHRRVNERPNKHLFSCDFVFE
jgi:hypothetical protein